jgi:hypothetical protein
VFILFYLLVIKDNNPAPLWYIFWPSRERQQKPDFSWEKKKNLPAGP